MEDKLTDAYFIALRFLAHKPRTEFEVAQRLQRYSSKAQNKLVDSDINTVLDLLREEKFLNDAVYVEEYLTSEIRNKRKSKLIIRRFLLSKGISQNLVDQKMRELVVSDHATLEKMCQKKLDSLMGKKLSKLKIKQRLVTYLLGKGFKSEDVFAVVDTTLSLK